MADLYTGIALLLVPVLAEYAKLRAKAERGFNLIAGAGVLTLLGVGFGVFNSIAGAEAVAIGGALLFDVIAWILLLIGALWATVNLAK